MTSKELTLLLIEKEMKLKNARFGSIMLPENSFCANKVLYEIFGAPSICICNQDYSVAIPYSKMTTKQKKELINIINNL